MKLSAKIAVSMGALAALMAVLGVYLIMQMSKVNDVATELSQRQIAYAATDAWIGRLIFLRMREFGLIPPVPASPASLVVPRATPGPESDA